MNKSSPVLVIGAGSIGERHINNLIYLGFEDIYVFRQRNLPFRNVNSTDVKIIINWEEIKVITFQFAIICTPTSQHLQQAINCINLGMHVLVEKPLSHSVENLHLLLEAAQINNKLVYVGYMMRFHPHIITVKKIIEAGTYGKLHAIHTHWGSYLPDWHPYEDYQSGYAAKKTFGGGVALTLSHDIDLANWLANGTIKSVQKHFAYSDDLQIDVESVADFQIIYDNNVVAAVHLNYLEKTPVRTYKFVLEHASITIDYFASTIAIAKTDGYHEDIIEHFDRNNLFISELEHFINIISSNVFLPVTKQQIIESGIIINLCKNE